MYCPKCKTQNPDNAQSCWFCHSVLTPVSPSSPVLSVKTSGLAIASLVLGILAPFTCFITAIPAIVLGIVALVKISKSAGQLKGSGLAITGIVIPPASLPIIALLMGIMMPAMARVRQVSFRMVCATNMSGLGKAMLIYANDNNDMFPTPAKWCDLLVEYQNVSKQTFACPAALMQYRSSDQCNYAMNKNVEELGTNAPPDMVLLFETQPGWNQSGGPEILTTDNHWGTGCNVLFVDGHVEFIKAEYLNNLKWDGKENEIAPPEPIPLPP
jgi:prepilin-type processing-associated H-X9-DG protein